ncbi:MULTISPECIES: NAD(+) synthase [Aminobacterium]|uniref:NAD(+) synthase n=1 Tax=Aminobacterium TaxID=81466 RepID=UPI00257C81FE|nr:MULTISPECIES: NAD(+) synthase [unclassified Aminobacterium]
MEERKDFFNLYNHNFVRVAACIPELKVSDPEYNGGKTIDLARKAYDQHAILAAFPELGLSSYTNEDLFFQDALQKSALSSLGMVLEATASMDMIVIVGAPLKVVNGLFNCAVVILKGVILGIAVKSFLPNYREFYELRHFRQASELLVNSIDILGQRNVPIGTDLIFEAVNIPDFRLFCEICEDLWTPIPPSSYAALNGATIIANLSASNVTIGKEEYRRSLASNQSARCISAYIYTASGPGESTTDLAWDGHAMIYENGELMAESKRFSWDPQVVMADVDLGRLAKDRMIMTSFVEKRTMKGGNSEPFRRIKFSLKVPSGKITPVRTIPRFPYVPMDVELRDKRCYEIFNIQAQGLAKRMKAAGLTNLVIGVSGGLDSTHALLICAKTVDMLGLSRENVKAYTLPGFATSEKTLKNAYNLMNSLGVQIGTIDIRPSCLQMLKDIGHPYAAGENLYDITFENVQAGQRTSILFRLANCHRGMVVGTGDLSELALGWCTYGVGDHMSHYNVNASLPKTLIQYIIHWVASRKLLGADVSVFLEDILNTEISPELIPGQKGDQPGQRTEAVIGPYELQDFNIFYITRYGFLPSKVAFLSWCAWHDVTLGEWPDISLEKRHQYTLSEIKYWLEIFIHRFYKTSQYKRSCVPNSPKVGSGGSLSPRGDYRAPSDSEETPWMEDLQNIPDENM